MVVCIFRVRDTLESGIRAYHRGQGRLGSHFGSCEGKEKTGKPRRGQDQEAVEKSDGAGERQQEESPGREEGGGRREQLWRAEPYSPPACAVAYPERLARVCLLPTPSLQALVLSNSLNLLSSPEICMCPTGSLTESPVNSPI